MDKSKKNLKIFSSLFIFLGAWDIITFLINYFSGSFDFNNTMPSSNQEIANIVLIIIIVFVSISALIKLYLGIKGLRQSQGKAKGKANLTIAKILFVLFLILLVLNILSIIQNQAKYIDLLNYIATLLIIFYYIKYVKDVTEK